MSIYKYMFLLVSLLTTPTLVKAQGPPITNDNPIMLGKSTKLLGVLGEYRATEAGNYTVLPFMFNYLPTSNTLLAARIPTVRYSLLEGEHTGTKLGNLQLLGKYQFFRNDKMGETFRMVAKTVVTFAPFGNDHSVVIEDVAMHQGNIALGVVGGYESLKYGLTGEIAYRLSKESSNNELISKFGFGLPVLKPTYPVKQLNIMFEYSSHWFPQIDEYLLFYSQGIQYAKGQLILEAAIQMPLIEHITLRENRKYSIFLGSRYVF